MLRRGIAERGTKVAAGLHTAGDAQFVSALVASFADSPTATAEPVLTSCRMQTLSLITLDGVAGS
ncbi:hypothetical protein LINGRAPRIM_LOCUS2265 [Linum grandiflorum]